MPETFTLCLQEDPDEELLWTTPVRLLQVGDLTCCIPSLNNAASAHYATTMPS